MITVIGWLTCQCKSTICKSMWMSQAGAVTSKPKSTWNEYEICEGGLVQTQFVKLKVNQIVRVRVRYQWSKRSLIYQYIVAVLLK